MKQFVFVVIAVLSLSILGCKPDSALKRGEVIDASPSTSSKDAKPQDGPVITKPTTDKESPVKQVQ